MNATFFVVFLLYIGTTYARRANRTRSFHHLLRVSLLISLVKDNEFIIHHFGEGKDREREAFALGPLSRKQTQG